MWALRKVNGGVANNATDNPSELSPAARNFYVRGQQPFGEPLGGGVWPRYTKVLKSSTV
jgi:hypothetical protein